MSRAENEANVQQTIREPFDRKLTRKFVPLVKQTNMNKGCVHSFIDTNIR